MEYPELYVLFESFVFALDISFLSYIITANGSFILNTAFYGGCAWRDFLKNVHNSKANKSIWFSWALNKACKTTFSAAIPQTQLCFLHTIRPQCNFSSCFQLSACRRFWLEDLKCALHNFHRLLSRNFYATILLLAFVSRFCATLLSQRSYTHG